MMSMNFNFRIVFISVLCYAYSFGVFAQNNFRNFGNLKVFENTELGFQTNLINDGAFDENLGRVGFYGQVPLTISGALVPQFHDFELFVADRLSLDIPIRISNTGSFFSGDIKTDKLDDSIYVEFSENAVHQGPSDLQKVDGYVISARKKEFLFPVGDNTQLKPLRLYFQNEMALAKCAYFLGDVNTIENFSASSTQRELDPLLSDISMKEFWHLQTEGTIQISLNWNQESELPSFIKELDRITIAGWNENTEQWDNIGKSSFAGSIENGNVTSPFFNTSDYQLFTFASLFNIEESTSDHFLVTANGDGVNDRLVIPELEKSPKNLLLIYNRNGRKVFEKENYTDEFGGFSTSKALTINKGKGLPEGIYFYLVKMYDLNREVQGFLYLTR